MRTTLDIAAPILGDLKRLQEEEKKSLGQLVSELLAVALAERRKRKKPVAPFRWIARPVGLRPGFADLSDKEALYDALDAELFPKTRR